MRRTCWIILTLTLVVCGLAETSEPARYVLPDSDISLELPADPPEMARMPRPELDPLPAQW